MRPLSLWQRLLLAGAGWMLLVFAAGGWGLSAYFELVARRGLDARLEAYADTLLAAVEVGDDGRLSLGDGAPGGAFTRPYSGFYWQVSHGEALARSASLWNDRLADVPPGTGWSQDGQGLRLRRLDRTVTLPDLTGPVSLTVAVSDAEMAADVADFNRLLWLLAAIAGVALPFLIGGQVRWAIAPLRRMTAEVAELRTGTRTRLSPVPVPDLAPLAGEVNALLDHTGTLLTRARAGAADLAHAVKTPLAVMRGELSAPTPDLSLLDEQIRQIDGLIGRHLARASAAGPGAGQWCAIAPLVQELAAGLSRLHQVVFEADLPPDCRVALERDDLAEVLGALMDNAGRFAHSKVTVSGRVSGADLHLTIADDGPGLAPDQRRAALARGQRFDTAPGSGLGLTIAHDLVTLYQGSLALADSPSGGLAVELLLPLA